MIELTRRYQFPAAHILSHPGLNRCPAHVQPIYRLVERLDVLLADLFPRNPIGGGTINDLVVNIGEILNFTNLEPSVFEVPVEHIENNAAQCVTKVRIVVNGHPANVHFYLVAEGGEIFFSAGK